MNIWFFGKVWTWKKKWACYCALKLLFFFSEYFSFITKPLKIFTSSSIGNNLRIFLRLDFGSSQTSTWNSVLSKSAIGCQWQGKSRKNSTPLASIIHKYVGKTFICTYVCFHSERGSFLEDTSLLAAAASYINLLSSCDVSCGCHNYVFCNSDLQLPGSPSAFSSSAIKPPCYIFHCFRPW